MSYEPSGRTALVPGFLAGVEAGQARFGNRNANGERYAVGETFRQPELAKTPRAVAKEGVREHVRFWPS